MSNTTKLGTASAIAAGDLFVINQQQSRNYLGAPQDVLLDWLRENLKDPDYEKTVVIPDTGFSTTLPQTSPDRWLLIRPTQAITSATVVLPSPNVARDGQQVLITSTLQITTLTIDGNGATNVYSSPSTLAAEGAIELKYEVDSKSWYVIK